MKYKYIPSIVFLILLAVISFIVINSKEQSKRVNIDATEYLKGKDPEDINSWSDPLLWEEIEKNIEH